MIMLKKDSTLHSRPIAYMAISIVSLQAATFGIQILGALIHKGQATVSDKGFKLFPYSVGFIVLSCWSTAKKRTEFIQYFWGFCMMLVQRSLYRYRSSDQNLS